MRLTNPGFLAKKHILRNAKGRYDGKFLIYAGNAQGLAIAPAVDFHIVPLPFKLSAVLGIGSCYNLD